MPPTPLLSVYQEYKKDTNSVAAWLASTARAAGCPSSLLTDCPATSGRLKGKDVAKSKKLSQDSNKYIIPVSKFIPLAEYVTSRNDPVITVPACVISAVERAISARSGFATRLSYQGETLDTEKNKKHSRFVTVLERTRDILRSKASMIPSPASAFCRTSEKDAPDVANIHRFASRGINQPLKEFTDMMTMERPEPVINDSNVYESEQSTSFRDALDIARMLSKDLSDIRDEIASSWRRFQDDYWDLPAAAAIASNTGLGLARFIIHQAEPFFEPHGGMVNFFEFFNLQTSEWLCGIYPDANLQSLMHRFYLLTTSNLNNCLTLVHNKRIEQLPPLFPNYDPTVPRERMSDDEKMDDDVRFLANLFVYSANLNSYIEGFPVLDEFIREVGRVLESEQMTFFLVFASQAFLDINHLIRKDALKAFDKMQQELNSIESTFESYLSDTIQKSKEDTKIIHNIRDVLRSIKKDQFLESVDSAARKNNMESPYPYERHLLYKLSPILCGLIIFHFRTRLYRFSTRPSAIAVIQDVAHLYHALPSEDMLDLDWEDLAEIENRLGLGAIFNSKSDVDRPSGTRAIIKSLALLKGASVFALKRMMNPSNKRLQPYSRRRTKTTVWSQTPLCDFFMGTYVQHSGRGIVRSEDVEELLSLSKFWSLHQGGDGHDSCIVAEDAAQGKFPNGASNPTKQVELFPHVLARELGHGLNKESVMFAFPYLVVENLCHEFLRDLSASPGLLTMQGIHSSWYGLPESPEYIVLFILLCNLHDWPGGKRIYRMAADALRSKLSTSWGRAGLDNMTKQWPLGIFLLQLGLL